MSSPRDRQRARRARQAAGPVGLPLEVGGLGARSWPAHRGGGGAKMALICGPFTCDKSPFCPGAVQGCSAGASFVNFSAAIFFSLKVLEVVMADDGKGRLVELGAARAKRERGPYIISARRRRALLMLAGSRARRNR
jgi:hypothetical protein